MSVDCAFDSHIKIKGVKNVAFHIDDVFLGEVAFAFGKQVANRWRVYLVIFASQ